MNRCATSLLAGMAIAASPTLAAEVRQERLLNADREPQNWLMNHRTYDSQRFSPLSRINRDNVKNLRPAFAVPLGGQLGKGAIEATPLAENGFLYTTDSSGVLYRIDATSGSAGRIVWTMDPKQDRPLMNRGAALWGNLVISPANWPARIVATDKDIGKVVWETDVTDGQPQLGITAAPLVINGRIIVGASMGDLGLRDWIAGLDASTGKVLWRQYTVPAPASRAARPGKGRTTPGRQAAAPFGLLGL
jgi:alcohol dehydrogenase (cytochrome c)